MSAPEAPEDNSVKLFKLEQQAQRKAEKQERKAEKKEKKELEALKQAARTGAYGNAERYFTSQGLVDDDYTTAIDAMINEIFSTIPQGDTNPGAYFKDVGQRIYEEEQAGSRNKALRTLNQIFAPNFENERIQDTTDDSILDALYQEQRGSAEAIVQNMLKRGVITDSGYAAALKDLDRQSAGAKARLTTLGDAEIAKGRGTLRNTANEGRQTASTMALGTAFDPYSYSSKVDQEFDKWLSGLDTNLRAVLPTDLFATGSLAATAGAGQGAQNTKFNPAALSGIIDEEDDNEDELDQTPESIF